MWPHAVALNFLFALIYAVANGDPSQGMSVPVPCLPGRPCTLALISNNPVTLRCPGAPHEGLLWQLRLKTRLIRGDLRIQDPGVEDSGVYTCHHGDATLAYYEVDFQDVRRLHVSHANLGEATLANATVDLAGGDQGKLFTAWARWQPCDRCGGPGERKRVGFCYAQLASHPQEPLSCGVAGRGLPQRGPELQVENCEVPCDGAYGSGQDEPVRVPLLVITRYRALPHARARLRCPTASIYRYGKPCHTEETQGPIPPESNPLALLAQYPTSSLVHPIKCMGPSSLLSQIRPMGPTTLVSPPKIRAMGPSRTRSLKICPLARSSGLLQNL
uniref:Immunoglobulin subtype 2 domain-containing protein n=1 Tax=Pelusios castaneus TaxID=367368 RepID=A0A8C8RIU7_9SAUR